MEKRIAIVGAGNLGSRHLQALAKINFPAKLQVVDPSSESLRIAEERFYQVQTNNNVKSIDFLTTIDRLFPSLDLCFIATNADVRYKVLQELLSQKRVKYLILEKVLFQSKTELKNGLKLIQANKAIAWVNCTRRIFPIYQEIRGLFPNNVKVNYQFSGGDWGIACNGIHFLDHITWLTNDKLQNLDISDLDDVVHPSKRQGNIELTGTLSGQLLNGSRVTLTSTKEPNLPLILKIQSDDLNVEVNETLGEASFFSGEDDWKIKSQKFNMPLQSVLITQVVNKLIMSGLCDLTPIEESCGVHEIFLSAIKEHLEKVTNSKYERCPIT
jgi:predicted dehydrogenase